MLTHSSIQLSSNCFSSNCAQPASIACRSFNTPIRAFKARSKQSKSSSRCKAVVPASAAVQDSKPGHTLGSHPTGSWQLYTCRMPLIGLEAVASALEGTPLAKLLQLHMYLLLEGPDQSGVWYLDFLPLNPTAPGTGLLLLTGSRAPGEVRCRRLGVQQVKANDKVRLLGSCSDPHPLAAVQAYNKQYDRGLHLLLNNCMHYTNGLTKALLEPPAQTAVHKQPQPQQQQQQQL